VAGSTTIPIPSRAKTKRVFAPSDAPPPAPSAGIRSTEAWEVLVDLADSDDEEISEAMATAEVPTDGQDDEQDEWVQLGGSTRSRIGSLLRRPK
jgi:hypothetical protein